MSRWVTTTAGVCVDFDNCGRITCHQLPSGKLRVTSIFGQFDLSFEEHQLLKQPFESLVAFWAMREREQLGLPDPAEQRAEPIGAQLPQSLAEAKALVLAAEKSIKAARRSNRLAIGIDFDPFRQ
jgi:hypothetical protein